MSRTPSEPSDLTPDLPPSPPDLPDLPIVPSLFQPPTLPPWESLSDPSPSLDPPLESPDVPPWSGGADAGDSPRRSTGSERSRRKKLFKGAKQLVAMAGGMVHQLLTAPETPEREAGLYLPDEDDLAAIADPLAGLASRRMPEGADNPDVADLIALAGGLAAYWLKQRMKRTQLYAMFGGLMPNEAQPEPQPDAAAVNL